MMTVGQLRARAYGLVKRTPLGPYINNCPPIRIGPERLYVWTHVLMQTRDVPGDVVEVGCSLGGTAIWSERMLRQAGTPKKYVAIDTFSGFVPEQFSADVGLGTPERLRRTFDFISLPAVRRSARTLGAPDVQFVQGDIVRLPAEELPPEISACLIDVDLSQPVYAALEKVWPRLAPGGVIVVDDCPPGDDYKARLGYQKFAAEHGLVERYVLGMGVLTGPSADIDFGHAESTPTTEESAG
ncbi:TylF/MycF/NovP-related O-methyltransferase [Streptomyces sp. NPDC050658]|uniref:TylF/MycF/NovP-related O-methyltransferase n=1 Tax=unclassified Streptomyces TaxID=2593676 RepID=UPI00341EF199